MTELAILKAASIIAASIAAAGAALGGSLGDAFAAAKALEGISRQPEARGQLFSTLLISVGLIEATPIIAIVISFILLYANPLLGK